MQKLQFTYSPTFYVKGIPRYFSFTKINGKINLDGVASKPVVKTESTIETIKRKTVLKSESETTEKKAKPSIFDLHKDLSFIHPHEIHASNFYGNRFINVYNNSGNLFY